MYEYLAYTCAVAGDLKAALSKSTVDRELLTSTGELLHALVGGGPAETLDDYEDAGEVVEAYLRCLLDADAQLGDYVCVNSLQDYLQEEEPDRSAREMCGWTTDRRDRVAAACAHYLALPIWSELADVALLSKDEVAFFQATSVAKSLGIATWDHFWRRLTQKPTDSGRWYKVASSVDDARLSDLLRFAEQNLDLLGLASGPADEMGLGPDWEQHSCLGYVLQDLSSLPGMGEQFLAAGLLSPVVRNRNIAINALAAWPRDPWSASAESALTEAISLECNDDVRERMNLALAGQPLDE